ncbi:MAG TPA: VOC family protein [Gemmatimonadaceae bacterium]|nr:VOC family protein [Gemmatimonadaceae bacterium]
MPRSSSVKTHGLTHVALAVRDPQRSLAFYRSVLGVVPIYEKADFVQAQTPGSRDVIVFERNPEAAGRSGGIAHFGFRLQRPADIARALDAIRGAGGTIRDHGEFVPGEPYVFFTDPDGYEVEIWYELPTPVDPPARERPASKRRAAARRPRQRRAKSA